VRTSTKNTLIAGTFVMVAALFTATAMFLTKDPAHNTEVGSVENVTSAGQSGGITGKAVSVEQKGGITADEVTIHVSSGAPATPTLVVQSATIEKKPDSYTAHILFLSSTKAPLGQVQFTARMEGQSDAKILSFFPGRGISMDSRSSVSKNRKQAQLSFSRSEAANPVKLQVSAPCMVAISGNHNLKPFVIDIK
jgi:hypothetical protein